MRNRNLIYIIGSLGGFLVGFNTGVISGALLPLEFDFYLNSQQVGFVTGSLLLGALFGALFAGNFSRKSGKKNTIILSSVLFLIGGLFAGLAQSYNILCISRIVVGIAIGIVSATVPAYLAEIAPPKQRGAIGTLFQFMIVSGILAGDIVCLVFLRSQFMYFSNWQLMFLFMLLPGFLFFFGSIFLPETPRYLLSINKKNVALKNLSYLRDDEKKINNEVKEIENSIKLSSSSDSGVMALTKYAKPALIAAIILGSFQQITGINSVFFYGPVIAQKILPPINQNIWYSQLQQDIWITLTFATVNFFATIVALFVIDKINRKTLLVFGGFFMGVSYFVLFIIIQFNISISPYIMLALFYLTIVAFAITWGPITWVMIGEIFPHQVRSIGTSIATFFNWSTNFLVMTLFPVIVHEVDGVASSMQYAYIFFAVMTVCAIILVNKFIPETRGISLEQIEKKMHINMK